MTTDIQSLIEQRPHLKDPLEFYEKWQKFQRQAAQLLSSDGSGFSPDDSQTYPRETGVSILQLFISTFNLPEKELETIRHALEAGDVDFMKLPLDEISNLSIPDTGDKLAAILYLFSRPYFLALRESCMVDGRQWEDGRCPLCSAKPAIASITEGPRRLLHCSWCGTVGPYRFTGCPNCGTNDASNLSTLAADEEKGVRIATCDACRTYVKIVDSSILAEMTPDLADMASLPLDIVAQEKEFTRKAPNPIGLTKME